MRKIKMYNRTVSTLTETATGSLTIQSPGWSGKVLRRDAVADADREFLLKVDMSINSDYGWRSTGHGSGGYTTYDPNGGIVGISLEHFGKYPDDTTVNTGGIQALGRAADGTTVIPAWGAYELDNQLTITDGSIYIHDNEYKKYTGPNSEEHTQTDVRIDVVEAAPNYRYFNIPVLCYGNWAAESTCVITTDLPIFATDADLLEYINSGGTIINKMLNNMDPAEEYKLNEEYYYIHNVWGHNTKNRDSYTDSRNYRFYPYTGRICLYRVAATADHPTNLVLYNYDDYTIYAAGPYDENFVPLSGGPAASYMSESLRFAANDYYTVFVEAEENTNIPIFDNVQLASDYANYLIDIDQADNYSELAIANNDVIAPDFGEEDTSTPIGANEQAYNIAGFHLYEVSHTELSSFFLEIFDPSPGAVDAILDGTKLFSGNEINAIMMCMFLPIDDISKICSMGSTSKITVGTWTADHSEGRRIASNDVGMSLGECFIPYRYNSEEDFEPYTNLYIQLPYCGTQQIQVSKYIGKTLRCDYAVSVADGSCKALLYADNILMDEFSGCMGCMRPITASDAAQYVSNIVNGIMGSGSSIASGATGALKSGLESGAGGDALGLASSALSAGSVAAGGVWKGYQLLQAAETPPMSISGSLSGGICYFGVQKPHLIIAQKATVRPANERLTIGYPSGRGAKVGQFSGFLKCSAVKLQNFTGTKEEYNELIQILSQGIYLS